MVYQVIQYYPWFGLQGPVSGTFRCLASISTQIFANFSKLSSPTVNLLETNSLFFLRSTSYKFPIEHFYLLPIVWPKLAKIHPKNTPATLNSSTSWVSDYSAPSTLCSMYFQVRLGLIRNVFQSYCFFISKYASLMCFF